MQLMIIKISRFYENMHFATKISILRHKGGT